MSNTDEMKQLRKLFEKVRFFDSTIDLAFQKYVFS